MITFHEIESLRYNAVFFSHEYTLLSFCNCLLFSFVSYNDHILKIYINLQSTEKDKIKL